MQALRRDNLEVAKLLVEKGANLFLKSDAGDQPIDRTWGPQLLQHAKDLRFATIKDLLIVSKACCSSPTILPSVASVFDNLTRHIATFLHRNDLIVVDPAIKEEDKEPDDVKKRVEAMLLSESNKTDRK